MPLKVTGNAKGMIRLAWTSTDGTSEASWKFGPETEEEKVLDLLERACLFVRRQRGEHQEAVEELENELGLRPAIKLPKREPVNGERIPMMPPTAVSDRPSDGGPPNDGFGWASLPTTAIPQNLATQWEMIPPGEQ